MICLFVVENTDNTDFADFYIKIKKLFICANPCYLRSFFDDAKVEQIAEKFPYHILMQSYLVLSPIEKCFKRIIFVPQ